MTFEEAQHRVKISHFTRQGFPITGVVHVGANSGYEIQFYFGLGAHKVMAFEPLNECLVTLHEDWDKDGRVRIYPCGLSDERIDMALNVSKGDGQGSTFLEEISGPYEWIDNRPMQVFRFDRLTDVVAGEVDLSDYNTLVVDTQGMELNVLRGFGELLKGFSFLNIECSRKSLYVGGVDADAVIKYLDEMGFYQNSPTQDHDDIMFIKKGVSVTWDMIRTRIEGWNDHYSISLGELEFIIKHALTITDNPTILELGVCHGRTLAALALVATTRSGTAYGIDHFGLEGSASQVIRSMEVAGIFSYDINVSNTHTFPWNLPIDFLVIDAGHDEANVRPDIEKYLPFVKPGGMVFFDDYDDPYLQESPHWAVRYYADRACADWEDLGIVEGVRGWRKPL